MSRTSCLRVTAGLLLILLVCGVLGLLQSRSQRTAFSAHFIEAGYVPSEYEGLTDYLKSEFPEGMTRDEVRQKLEAKFSCQIDSRDPHADHVLFPTQRDFYARILNPGTKDPCTPEECFEWRNGCRPIEYVFMYDSKGMLYDVWYFDSA